MGPAEAFERVWGLTVDVERALTTVFDCRPNPELSHLQVFGEPGLGGGSLFAQTGGLVERMLHLRSGAPERGLAEAQLALWLTADIDVPHLRIGFGVLPDLHWWLELLPRRDLSLDVEALEAFHVPADERRRRILADDRFELAFRPGLHERSITPPSAFHVCAKDAAEVLPIIEAETWGAVEEWLGWVDAAPQVDPEEQPYLAERDAAIRWRVAQLDPVANTARAAFGNKVGDDVLRAMAG